MADIASLIPHRAPFLLLDEIVELADASIRARTTLRPQDELWSRVYAGHYPGNPITPGVFLCEIVFQAGAALMAHRLKETRDTRYENRDETPGDSTQNSKLKTQNSIPGTPVIVRIRDAKFKQMVKPGDVLDVEAAFDEQVSNAYYLHGTVKVRGQLAVRVEFTCALVPAS